MALAITLLAGAFFLLGAAVAWRVRGVHAVAVYSLAIAFGSLAFVAAFDLIPEAIEAVEVLGWPVALLLATGGALVLIALDRVMPDHHTRDHVHEQAHDEREVEEDVAHIGNMAVLAISVHNLAEGAAIYAISTQDVAAGLALAIGVGLHNAPLGMLLYAPGEDGRRRETAVLVAASLSTFAGGLLMFLLGGLLDESVMLGVVCLALGMIVYILFAELLPAMIRGGEVKRSVAGIAIGAAFVLAGMSLG